MNKPIVIGQATEFSAQRNAPARVIKLAKPDGGQAFTITLGYDQNFKLDLSGISNEKITLVHVGERLIILFDNQSTLTINPFYDSANAILGNISFDVGNARVIDGTQFAGIFPITEDQSVLPAAGDGGPQSGANFRDASVDPLATPDPLPLLPPEALGNFVVNDIIGRNLDTVEPLRFLGLRMIVEEDQLGHGNQVGLSPRSPTATKARPPSITKPAPRTTSTTIPAPSTATTTPGIISTTRRSSSKLSSW